MILKLVVLTPAIIVMFYVATLLPFKRSVDGVFSYVQKVKTVLLGKWISDHWKEKVLPIYASRIITLSLIFLASLVAVCIPLLVPALFWPGGLSVYLQDLLSPGWIIFMLSLTFVLVLVNKARNSKDAQGSADYSPLDKALHYLLLDKRFVLDLTFEIEKLVYLRRIEESQSKDNVFVTGLARAGTTVLMREIYATGKFASLTYKDMPLVLAPNIWKQISPQDKSVSSSERAHGDGIVVDLDSPEAFEDVFWRCKDEEQYLRKDHLASYSPDSETLESFSDYIRLVTHSKNMTRYLSKNNNNILRLPYLAESFPASRFLVVFRHPVTHAASLLRQHKKFGVTEKFTTDYMRWLVHHEFGKTHLPFFKNDDAAGSEHTVEYWLSIWINVYGSVVQQKAGNIIPICHEDLVGDSLVRTGLGKKIGVPEMEWGEIRNDTRHVEINGNDTTLKIAMDIYSTLQERQNSLLGLSVTA